MRSSATLAEHVVVERLAPDVLVGQRDPQHRVGVAQVVLGQLHELVPQPLGVRVVARLQLDHPLPGPGGERRVGVELDPRRLVEGVRVGPQQRGLGGVVADVDEVLEQHAERRAPVAHVVVPDHVVAGELEHPDDGVAHDRGAQVADVHRLRDVGRGVVDHDRLRPGGGRDAEPGVGQQGGGGVGDPLRAQRQVDETGAADRGRLADVVDVEVADDLGGDVAGRPAELLGQRKGGVGLEVAERRRADQRVRVSVVRTVRGHQGIAHPRAENLLRICHGASLVFACPHLGINIPVRPTGVA